ncbi:MAG TPA: hypothetical protein VN577_17560 [Terriglobales bacterium]|nr:hypothetical protein [Terriglobales bacterium]
MSPLARIALLLALLLPFVSLLAQQNPDERDYIAKVRLLETDPTSKEAGNARTSLMLFTVLPPRREEHRHPCLHPQNPLRGKGNKKHAADLLIQPQFSEQAFIYEHPDQSNDDLAVTRAGVEGMLRVYEAILKKEAFSHWEYLDDLLKLRDAGKLDDHIREMLTSCAEEKS